jgi:hypothetical protein
MEEKRKREENNDNIGTIQKYLLGEDELAKSTKPILWIHVPYEYNSRDWLSFESRKTMDLNQPYLYLTVRTIIEKCKKDFTICMVDDASFAKLLPTHWSIEMKTIASPITEKIRLLGQVRLLHRYGGIWCPISFLCRKSLLSLYEKATQGDQKPFLCEMVNRNITSTDMFFYPSLRFCGGPKEHEMWTKLSHFMERTISNDFTTESVFLGECDRWCNRKIQDGQMTQVNGIEIGVKKWHEDQPILLEDLLSNHYLKIYPDAYGIYIPAEEVLKRRKYEWFARMSSAQILSSNTILGNYFLLTLGEESQRGNNRELMEPLVVVRPTKHHHNTQVPVTGFWKTPLYSGLYGNKPNFLGDNLRILPYPGAT